MPYDVMCVFQHPDGQKEYAWLKPSNLQTIMNNEYKPLVRPLSDLAKEITHHGETFHPVEHYANCFGANDDVLYENTSEETGELQSNCQSLPQYVFEWLVSLHFDVFGLIGRGLALPVEEGSNG